MAEIESWDKNKKKDLKFKEKTVRKGRGWEILDICIIFYKCLRSKCKKL